MLAAFCRWGNIFTPFHARCVPPMFVASTRAHNHTCRWFHASSSKRQPFVVDSACSMPSHVNLGNSRYLCTNTNRCTIKPRAEGGELLKRNNDARELGDGRAQPQTTRFGREGTAAHRSGELRCVRVSYICILWLY